MIKKEIKIDDYIKDIKNNKLEIISVDTSKTKSLQETIIINFKKENEKENTIKNDKDNINSKDNDNINNNFTELTCLGKYKELKYLTINNKNIIQINSYCYSHLKNLETLDLSHNIIGKISKKITNLANLKILILNDNFISVLPPFLKDLKNLEELNLNNNRIEFIPTSIQYFPSLKILNVSQNNIERLPIEIGLINKLESLSIERNEFTEIPTTLCYLENLKCLNLEWFEFLDPELPKEQKDKNIIESLKIFLKNKLMNSFMYIDFNNFQIKMSENIQKKLNEEDFNNENLDNIKGYDFNLKDIFYALNNNYLGVIKSLVNDNQDLIRTKDSYTGKNLLYLSIQQNKKKIYDYLLDNVDINIITNKSSILFRTIRSRNYELLIKLAKLGFPLDMIDLKGNNVYHVLFSVFNKNYEQCVQIGNFLIEKNVPGYNKLNNDRWAPIHIAAKYSSYICFEWIGHMNKILSNQNKEIFNINLLGKNNYTAFHLTCYAYKYCECISLLNLGSNLLLRASDGKLPKNTTYNFFLTKMLFKKEQELFYNKYILNNLININVNVNKKGLITTKSFSNKHKILFTFDNYYDIKYDNRLTFINSERSKSEIICDNQKYSLLEKYQNLMMISLSNSKEEIVLIIKDIFKIISFQLKQNFIIICDLLNIIQNYNLYEFYFDLKRIKNKLNKKNLFLIREIDKIIIFLEKNKGNNMGAHKAKLIIDNNNINKNKCNKSILLMKKTNSNKFLNMTETDINNYVLNREINKINHFQTKKKFGVPGFQKIKEKKVQESITSMDFEE